MTLIDILKKNKDQFGLVLDMNYRTEKFGIIDFTKNNIDLESIRANKGSISDYIKYVNRVIKKSNGKFGVGLYNENRAIYSYHNGEKNINPKKSKTIHLGIDLFVPDQNKIKSPLSGVVHTFDIENYQIEGGFGATVVLKHQLDGINFYTLYGHISLDSFYNIQIGKEFEKGEVIGGVANEKENGAWPPHLHFQIINKDAARSNMFFGATSPNRRKTHLKCFPDPNLILGIDFE